MTTLGTDGRRVRCARARAVAARPSGARRRARAFERDPGRVGIGATVRAGRSGPLLGPGPDARGDAHGRRRRAIGRRPALLPSRHRRRHRHRPGRGAGRGAGRSIGRAVRAVGDAPARAGQSRCAHDGGPAGRAVAALRRRAGPGRSGAGDRRGAGPGGAAAARSMATTRLVPSSCDRGSGSSRRELLARLVAHGYRREHQVEHRGEVAVRGGIVDVFPSTADGPVRIDLFGDEVDRLTTFDVGDQRSVADLDAAVIFGCREMVLTDAMRARCRRAGRVGVVQPRAVGTTGRGRGLRRHGGVAPVVGRGRDAPHRPARSGRPGRAHRAPAPA